MNTRRIITLSVLSAAVILTSAITSSLIVQNRISSANRELSTQNPTPVTLTTEMLPSTPPTDFTYAAEHTIESVVHVKVKIEYTQGQQGGGNPLFDFFFGIPSQPQTPQIQEGSGSGVIISNDGYIVTNNHVVDQATTIEVTLNDKRTFQAKLIGTDKSTDLALLKIDANNLPTITLGNSDSLRVGEWVLAVGNPFNLTSTVTAGIVSAKARNINILNSEMKIESFIQTDAAVNPGNSGGALVNTHGELIGINTAIASRTGSYTGYSFAVPVSIVSKVIADLREYSVVQRAVLGVQIREIDNQLANEKELKQLKGVYVAEVIASGSAEDAGIKQGDIITHISSIAVNSVAELQEQVGRHRPGDEIDVTYIRNGKKITVQVKLKNRSGNTNIVKADNNNILGATFKPVDQALRNRYRLSAGVQIAKLEKNGLLAKSGLTKDFIILKINGQIIESDKTISDIVNYTINANDQERVLFITGAYPNGKIAHFAVNLE